MDHSVAGHRRSSVRVWHRARGLRGLPCARQSTNVLLVEGPGNAEITGVAGGQLLGALVESEGTAAAEGHAQRNVAVVLLEHRLSGGAAPDVLLNVTAAEQARPDPRAHAAHAEGRALRCACVARLAHPCQQASDLGTMSRVVT